MTFWKKIVVGYFILLLTVFVLSAFLHGYGIREVSPGTFETLITFFSIAVIPVVIAAIRTTDFFRDDPNDVARLKKEHAKEIRDIREENLTVVVQRDAECASRIAELEARIEAMKPRPPRPEPPSSPHRS